MAKMIKDTVKQVHAVTGEEGAWVRIVKNWTYPSKANDKTYNGMAYKVAGNTNLYRDKDGNDISNIIC